jgi:hypothetical protein
VNPIRHTIEVFERQEWLTPAGRLDNVDGAFPVTFWKSGGASGAKGGVHVRVGRAIVSVIAEDSSLAPHLLRSSPVAGGERRHSFGSIEISNAITRLGTALVDQRPGRACAP